MAQEGFSTMQSYEPSPDLFSLQTGMEMMGFPQKGGVLEQHHQGRDQREATGGGAPWRTGFFPKHGGAVTIAATDPLAQYYEPQENLMAAGSNTTEWVQPPFQQPQMIPATPTRADHHQLNHGLSLSLFNPNPNSQQQQQQIVEVTEDGRFQLLGSQGLYHHQQQQQQVQLQMRCSKFLVPVQELLSEFCNLGSHSKKKMPQRSSQWEDGTGGGGPSSSSSSSWNQQSLQSLDILELQRRKAKLMLMLEEVDRRYRKYCDQMRGVVASFEAVAGEGSASVYSSLAARAMSRHFRCLRDGIVGHIRATKKAMGEKDGGGAMSAPGATKGETPRLKIVDQYIRQQKLFQQGGLMESHPWRPQRGLPERSVSILRAWLFEHFLHPYPSDVDKHILARQTGLSRSQVSNWFINARVRLWKPMVEEMYNEETKDQQQQENPSSSATTTIGLEGSTTTHHRDHHLIPTVSNPNPTHPFEDQKPDSDSLSSVIVNHHRVGRPGGFGVVDNIDFSSYSSSVGHQNHHQGFANNVSLTLGLQQHDGGGMNLSFSPAAAAQQGSVFFAREAMENCNQPVQFSILDGEGQSMALPYRNLMGAQLLHDLAG